MPISIGVSGTYRNVKPSIGVGGVWRPAKAIWIGVGGTWRKLYDSIKVVLTNRSPFNVVQQPTDCSVGYRINSDGSVDGAQNNSSTVSWNLDYGTWLLSGAASDYEVRATITSGTLTSSSGTGTWLNCGTTRAWSITKTENAETSQSCTLTIEIRDVATATVQASCTVNMTATITDTT